MCVKSSKKEAHDYLPGLFLSGIPFAILYILKYLKFSTDNSVK